MKSFLSKIKQHKLLTILIFLLLVGVVMVANVFYVNWADRKNAQTLENRMTAIYHKLQTTDADWQLKKTCTQPGGGYFGSGTPFCDIHLRHVESLDTINEVKPKINKSYVVLRSITNLFEIDETDTDIYPNLSHGFEIADDQNATGGSASVGCQVSSVKQEYCWVEYIIVNKDEVSEVSKANTKNPESTYFLVSLVRSGINVKKPYYYPNEKWPDAYERGQMEDEEGW